MTDAKRRCTHTTKAGHRCKAWAVHGTDPPPPAASTPASPAVDPPSATRTPANTASTLSASNELRDLIYLPEDLDSIDDEIIVAKIALRRVLIFLDQIGNRNQNIYTEKGVEPNTPPLCARFERRWRTSH